MMFWVCIEDADTHDVSEFEPADEMDVLWLMDGYKVDTSNPETFRVCDVEAGHHVVYVGVVYRGGFGVNLWVARKYREL